MQIQITSIPPGEAPENIRAAWVGLILPLADPGPETIETAGVLSRKPDTENGFAVDAVQAIEILESHSPDAARWWRENASSCIQPGQQLIFSAESCQEMPDEFEYFGTYRNSDARRLLDALTERDIRFEIEIDDSAIKNMSPFQLLFGGTFGTGSRIAVSIHQEDLKEAENVRKELFKTE